MREGDGDVPKRERTGDEWPSDEPHAREFTEEELEAFFQEAEEEERQPSFFENNGRKKWIAVLLSLVLFANVIAFLPQFFSLAAIQFLKISSQLSQSEPIQQYKQSVVVIRSDDRKGTGFLISDSGRIVTNRHVVGEASRSTVHFPNGESYTAKVIARDPDVDIAILDIGETGNRALRLSATGEAAVGEPVYIIGNPLVFNGIANVGHVWGVLTDREPPIMAVQAPIYKGNSGSPVINHNGEVIGVVFATSHVEQGGEKHKVGLVVPAQWVWRNLPEAN